MKRHVYRKKLCPNSNNIKLDLDEYRDKSLKKINDNENLKDECRHCGKLVAKYTLTRHYTSCEEYKKEMNDLNKSNTSTNVTHNNNNNNCNVTNNNNCNITNVVHDNSIVININTQCPELNDIKLNKKVNILPFTSETFNVSHIDHAIKNEIALSLMFNEVLNYIYNDKSNLNVLPLPGDKESFYVYGEDINKYKVSDEYFCGVRDHPEYDDNIAKLSKRIVITNIMDKLKKFMSECIVELSNNKIEVDKFLSDIIHKRFQDNFYKFKDDKEYKNEVTEKLIKTIHDHKIDTLQNFEPYLTENSKKKIEELKNQKKK